MKACADETQNECKTECSTSCTVEKVTHCKEKHKKQCDMMGQKWDMVREFISQSGDTMNDETIAWRPLSSVGKASPHSHQGQDLVSRQSTRIRLAPY